MFVFMYMLSVSYYAVSPREIVVVRKASGSFSIPLIAVNSVAVVEKPAISFRVLAYAGMWGYYGRFFSEDDNQTVRIYGTNLRNMVRIETTDGKIYYLSPAEPEKFVEAVRQRLKPQSLKIDS
ncbi:PH domain-containing protein [Ammonifex degensii]